MDEQQELVFDDVSLKEVPVVVGGRRYVLREATGGAVSRWRTAAVRGSKMDDKKVISFGDVGESELVLVAECLYEVTHEGGNGRTPRDARVPIQVVRAWPSRVVRSLFEKAKEISGLTDLADTPESLERRIREDTERLAAMRAGEEALKNSPEGSAGGSGSPGTSG